MHEIEHALTGAILPISLALAWAIGILTYEILRRIFK